MKKTTTNAVIIDTKTDLDKMLAFGNAVVYTCLRARHSRNGQQTMLDLMWMQYRDHIRESVPDIAAQALQAERERAEHAELATQAERAAYLVSTDDESRAELLTFAAMERKAAADALARMQELDKIISTTSHSDRADLVQVAILSYLEYTSTHDMNTEDASRDRWRVACKAVGQAIQAIAAAKGCTATRTKLEPISAQDAQAWIDTYGENARIPFTVREGMSAGHITVEYRKSKAKDASRAKVADGWYKVYHYRTNAPYVYYMQNPSEDSDSGEEMTLPQLTTNGGINAIMDEYDNAKIEALISRAKLSARERLIVRYMMDNTAAMAGAQAVADHMHQTAQRIAAAPNAHEARAIQRKADKQTESIRSAAQRDNAMTRAGIVSDGARRKALHTIRAKFAAALEDK